MDQIIKIIRKIVQSKLNWVLNPKLFISLGINLECLLCTIMGIFTSFIAVFTVYKQTSKNKIEIKLNKLQFSHIKYLEKENTSDLLKFWIQAENFTRNLLNFNSNINCKSRKKLNDELLDKSVKNEIEILYKQWQNDAMIIYDK